MTRNKIIITKTNFIIMVTLALQSFNYDLYSSRF